MKKFITLLSAAVIITSCGSIKPASRIVSTSFLDYREFTKENFLLSPDPYPAEYEAVGEIQILVIPEVKKGYAPPQLAKPTANGLPSPVVYMENITYNELARLAVDEAKRLGADAIVNFSIVEKDRIPAHKAKNQSTTQYVINGFCIKRK